mgnify:CR=1 FL=1
MTRHSDVAVVAAVAPRPRRVPRRSRASKPRSPPAAATIPVAVEKGGYVGPQSSEALREATLRVAAAEAAPGSAEPRLSATVVGRLEPGSPGRLAVRWDGKAGALTRKLQELHRAFAYEHGAPLPSQV